MRREIYLCLLIFGVCVSACSKSADINQTSAYFGTWNAIEVETKDGIIQIDSPVYADFAFSITISENFMLFEGALGDQKYLCESRNDKFYLYKKDILIYEITILSFENDILAINMLSNGTSMKTKLKRGANFY